MNIRHATHDDIPRIVEMAQDFYAQTSYAQIVPLAKESAAGLAILLMADHILLIAEHEGQAVGMAGLFIEPFTFNISKTVATEIVWYVEPDARATGAGQALLTAIEPAAMAKGAHLVRMMTLHSSPPQAAALYARRGYVPTEHAFSKELH